MKFHTHGCRVADNANLPHEVDVISGLAYTPSEMTKMMAKGSNISLDVLSSEAQYDSDKSMALPIDRQRGSSLNDVWEANADSYERLKNFSDKVINKVKETKV